MKTLSGKSIILGLVAGCLLTSCGGTEKSSENNGGSESTTLKEAFEGDFYIGAALNYDHVYGREDSATTLVKTQFNSISPENMLKMGPVHPEQFRYNFEPADKFVEYRRKRRGRKPRYAFAENGESYSCSSGTL